MWYLLKSIAGCLQNNPQQIQRIADTLHSMTAEETVVRLEAAPKLNTQMGPMFNSWLRGKFPCSDSMISKYLRYNLTHFNINRQVTLALSAILLTAKEQKLV